jgi:hypothetical protein
MKIQRETNYDKLTARITAEIGDAVMDYLPCGWIGAVDHDAPGGPVVRIEAEGRTFEVRLVEVVS